MRFFQFKQGFTYIYIEFSPILAKISQKHLTKLLLCDIL
jgi:hypothetical protein